MRSSRLWPLAAALLLAMGAGAARAQDSNYWSISFGTRARLLGGVVIGSPGDISSVFYNPGALALTANTELLLAGSAYQYQRVQVEGGSGTTRNLVSSSFSDVPSLFAGEIPRSQANRLAYSFLTRQSMDMEINSRATTGVESSSPIANPNFAALAFQLHQNLSENWFGVTWSHLLTPRLGLGISPYLAVRSQKTVVSYLAEGQNAGGQSAILTIDRDFDYLDYRLLAKLGLSGARDSLTYGVTLTTPGLPLFGGGAVHANTSLIDQTGNVGNVIGASYQEDIPSTYHSPVGAGAGASYGWGSTRFHASAEWFNTVPQFTVLPAADFVIRTPSGDSTVTAAVTEKLDAVFNYGVGLEHRFSDVLVGFVSYHTDRSGRKDRQPPGASITSWDLQHVTGGATLHAWRSDFALGLTTAFATQPTPVLPPRPDGRPSLSNAQVHELLIIVSFGWKVTF